MAIAKLAQVCDPSWQVG